MTNRRELADMLGEAAAASDCEALATLLSEASVVIREPGAGEVLRVVGVAHLYRLEGHEDPRAVPVLVAAPAPNRHHNLFALTGGKHPDESGFILSDGSFADRKRACVIALAAGQADAARMPCPGTLYSEDLW